MDLAESLRRTSAQLSSILESAHGVQESLMALGISVRDEVQPYWQMADGVRDVITLKLLEAFQTARVSDHSIHVGE